MATGKLTSRFRDGNSRDGGRWDRGPFGGGNFRLLSWSPFLLLPLTPQNVTAAQIILKDRDDIDALCPTNSSPKYILLMVSSCK